MSDPNASKEPLASTPKPALKPHKSTTTARARKPTDPRKLALRQQFAEASKAIDKEDASTRMLRVIIDKRLDKMTPKDQEALFDHLAGYHTIKLPLSESPVSPPHPEPQAGPTGG